MYSHKKYLIILTVVFCCANSLFAQQKTLDSFLNAAKENSPLLKSYVDQIAVNRLDSAILKKTFGPQVSINSNDYYAPVINTWGYDEIATNIDLFTALLSVSLEISGKKTKDNLFSNSNLVNQSLENISNITEQDIAKTVTNQYINVWTQLEYVQFNNSLLELLQDQAKTVKHLSEASVYKQVDYLAFLIAVQQQEFLCNQTIMNYRNELNALNYLCGISDTNYYEVIAPSLQLNALPSFNTTFVKHQFYLDSLLLENQDKQIDLSYKPRFSVYADAGYTSTFQLDAYKNFGASIGLNLSIPVYDGGQKQLQHQKIQIRQQSIQDFAGFAQAQFNQQKFQLTNQLKSNSQLQNQLDVQLNSMRVLLEANKKLLSTGEIPLVDYMMMLSNYKTMQSQIIGIETTRNQLVVQLNYLNAAN